MIAPFDIFKCEAVDRVIWVGGVDDLDSAKVKVAELMKDFPCEYMIVSLKTRNTLGVKPDQKFPEISSS